MERTQEAAPSPNACILGRFLSPFPSGGLGCGCRGRKGHRNRMTKGDNPNLRLRCVELEVTECD